MDANLIFQGIPAEQFKNELIMELLESLKGYIQKKDAEATSNSDAYLTEDEVCKLLKISIPKLYNLVRQGYLNKYRIGTKTVRYRLSEVESFMKTGEKLPENPPK